MKKTGFTLIEVLVVLLIMGFLLSVGVLQYNSSIENSKRVAFQSTVLNALSAAESYRQKYGEYPSTATLNLLFNDTAYFTTKPINPYTSQPLQATTDQSPETSSKLGYFYYNVKPDGSIEVITNPVVDINLASGSLAGGSLPSYTVTFTVKDTSGSVISGAQVTIGGQTASTNTSGIASATLPQSSYFYSVNKDGYNFYTGNINLTGNTPVTVTLSPKTYTVTIFVMDANTGNPISGATVSGIGSGGTTDPNGKLTLTNVTAQSYTAQVSAVGYTNTSKSITVNNNQQVNITLATGSCTITFNITNGAGALLQLSDGSSFTLGSGGVKSVSKPCGQYGYTISEDGYAPLFGQISALESVSIKGTLTAVSGDALAYNFVYDTIVISFGLSDSVATQIKNRGVKLINSTTGGATTIDLYAMFKSFYPYMQTLTLVDAQAVAIGGGAAFANGNTGQNGSIVSAHLDTLPTSAQNYSLNANVNIGKASDPGSGKRVWAYDISVEVVQCKPGYSSCSYGYDPSVTLASPTPGGDTTVSIPGFLKTPLVAAGGRSNSSLSYSSDNTTKTFDNWYYRWTVTRLINNITVSNNTLPANNYNIPDVLDPWSTIYDLIAATYGKAGTLTYNNNFWPSGRTHDDGSSLYLDLNNGVTTNFQKGTDGVAFLIVQGRIGLPK